MAKERNASWLLKYVFIWRKPWQTVSWKVVKAWWPLGSGGICHWSYANPLLLGPESGEGMHGAACWQNRHRMLPPAFLPNLFLPFSFMAFHEMNFLRGSFTGQHREISICIIFNSLQRIPPPTHKTMCFYKENINIKRIFPHMASSFRWCLNSLMV
jgi:hypothetical protein